jgi:alpha-N-arabinofuranosidase
MLSTWISAGVLVLAALPCAAQGFSDDFDAPVLDGRWEWTVPKAGPTISLTQVPGHLHLSLPRVQAGYNHWVGGNGNADAPLLLAPAPEGDFTAESHIKVAAFDPDGSFHVTLTVAFSRRYLVGWGPYYSTTFGSPRGVPQVWCEPTGQGHYLADPAEASDTYLRIEKAGNTYTFSLRGTPEEPWRVTGTWTSALPAKYVGVMGKTFGDGGPVLVDVDYVKVTPRASAPAPKPTIISVDAAGPSWPLDRRRYGFFIEHLARCIDGGLWAQMLRNRKFTSKASADGVVEGWLPLVKGEGITYAHDNREFYCPAQSQRLSCADRGKLFGILQEKLSLRTGINYRLRLVARQRGLTAPLRVGLMQGDRPLSQVESLQVGEDWTTREVELKGPARQEEGQLVIACEGPGTVWLGAISLMPTDSVDGLRADALAAIREMKVPMVRWPGGNFVSQYDWRDAIGPQDRRPPRWNRAWNQWEFNDLGTDEFLRFCELVDTEPYICVNCGEGQAAEAAAWVEYCNGPADSPWGKVRARNGHPEPYGVKVWSLGNEMWGDWQHGHLNATNYGIKAVEMARAMKAVDPSIRLIGNGVPTGDFGNWNRDLCPILGPEIDWLSVHFYQPETRDPALDYAAILGAAGHEERMLAATYDLATQAAGKPMPLAYDEWNVTPRGTQCLRNGLFHCLTFNALHRLGPKVPIANLALLINIFGALDVTPTQTVRSACHQAFVLYGTHYAATGVPVKVDGPQVGLPNGNATVLDVVAGLSEDHKTLYVYVVNRLATDAVTSSLEIKGFAPQASVRLTTLNAETPETINQPDSPDRIKLAETTVSLAQALHSIFPAHSATVMEFTAQ